MPQEVYLEMKARTADTKGYLWLTGSLGVQYVNPKMHWVYKMFKEHNNENASIYEFPTAINPYFPKDELERLRDTLDPQSYRQMFEINWDVQAKNTVYSDFADLNTGRNLYRPDLPVQVSIDWGFAHPTAVGFFQYDDRRDVVYLVDEIYKSGMKLDELWAAINSKGYRINEWYCDPAGLQTREQTAMSNVQYMKEKYNVHFKWRRSNVIPGIAFVRSYILSTTGQRRFHVDERCTHSIDELKSYRFKEVNGQVLDEPIKEHDDAVDMIRYYFVNHIAPRKKGDNLKELDKWQLMKW